MPYNILLVDDDRDFRDEVRDYLEDYRIIEASNGEEALKLLRKPNEIDLVILDVMMPGLHGTEVLKEIKRIAPDLGIIILTGYSSEDVAIEALKGHADDYIEKPLNINKIKESIEDLLEATEKKSSIDTSSIRGKIERVRHFAERNYHKKVCLKDAAQAVCLSPKYLSRIFKENTGIEFSQYKLEIKIAKSKELLEKSGYNIDQISDIMGYQNIESFTRIFKKLTGYTPTEYRKRKSIKHKKTSAKRAKIKAKRLKSKRVKS